MRIQELEHLVGIERATIRYYEKEGLIDPKRSENGYRDYSESDAAELRRIRLLRDLGVSLDTIKGLQQGREDMASVMARQYEILGSRREQMARAQAVCEQISSDGASYLGLDTDRYQNLLTQPPQAAPTSKPIFRENTHREPHPWRRYFARMLDHTFVAALVWFIVVVLLRFRPAGEGLNTLIGYGAWFIMMPLEALCLRLWGATPGKRIFGIRVEAAEGGYLTFSEALERCWRVFYSGMGMGVPLLNLYCMFKAYKAHSDTWDTDWDYDCEVSFRKCNWKNILLGIVMFASAVGLNVFSNLDAELPKYRSNELSVRQFAANFNFYDFILMNNTTEHMEPDGILTEPGYTQAIGLPDGGEVAYDPNGQFTFETSGNTIDRITYSHSWYEYKSIWYDYESDSAGELDELARWIPSHCRMAIFTAVLSQEGLKRNDLAALAEKISSDLKVPTGEGQSFTYGTVTVSWALDLEPYRVYEEGSSYPDIYHVTLDMTIEWA